MLLGQAIVNWSSNVFLPQVINTGGHEIPIHIIFVYNNLIYKTNTAYTITFVHTLALHIYSISNIHLIHIVDID
jgi:hypothetical protein